MRKSVSLIIPEKKDPFSRIKKFMSNEESGVVLTAKEEEMLSRWIYANSLLSENKYTREDVAKKIQVNYKVSIHTARLDIDRAYSLFVKITDDYKRYTLFHHIEQINAKIQAWGNDKSLAPLLPKLYAEKTRAIAALPVELQAPDVPAPIIIINTTTGILQRMTTEEAIAEADKLIEFEKQHEELDFEDLADDGKE